MVVSLPSSSPKDSHCVGHSWREGGRRRQVLGQLTPPLEGLGVTPVTPPLPHATTRLVQTHVVGRRADIGPDDTGAEGVEGVCNDPEGLVLPHMGVRNEVVDETRGQAVRRSCGDEMSEGSGPVSGGTQVSSRTSLTPTPVTTPVCSSILQRFTITLTPRRLVSLVVIPLSRSNKSPIPRLRCG